MSPEAMARRLTVCPACGKEKQVGCVVCWDCFKRIDNPYKYADMEFEDWIRTIPANETALAMRLIIGL